MHNIFKNSPCLRTPIGLSQYLTTYGIASFVCCNGEYIDTYLNITDGAKQLHAFALRLEFSSVYA